MATHRCPRCSAVLPVSAQFCRRCGASQGESAPRAAAIPPPIQALGGMGTNADRPQSAQPVPFSPRPRRPLLKLLGFLFLIGTGLLFVVRGQESVPSAVSVPATAAPDAPTVYSYPQPNPAPVIIEPAPQIVEPVLPSYSNRDDDHHHESREHDDRRR